MRGKRIKDKLRAGQVVFTTGLTFSAPRLVEMLGRSGVDQLFLDAEHGPLSELDCEEMVRAADLYDLPILVRVPTNEPHVILRYLDVGTSGIMVPRVTKRADAVRAVRAVRYPPEGERGFAPGRAAELLGLGPVEYMTRANQETFLLGLFEDVAGLDDVEAICQVEGLDGLFVGAFDLASTMGLPGQPWHADVQAVVERVRLACRAHRMPFGTVPRDRADLSAQIERGCQILFLGTLQWGIEATRRAAEELTVLSRQSSGEQPQGNR
jgi:2-keto-3-deoxy-L-rhamnonate aldolase RhmA